jgi:hypothetical protein
VEIGDDVAWVDELVEQMAVGLGRCLVQDANRIFQVRHGARADDGRGDAGLVLAPTAAPAARVVRARSFAISFSW